MLSSNAGMFLRWYLGATSTLNGILGLAEESRKKHDIMESAHRKFARFGGSTLWGALVGPVELPYRSVTGRKLMSREIHV